MGKVKFGEREWEGDLETREQGPLHGAQEPCSCEAIARVSRSQQKTGAPEPPRVRQESEWGPAKGACDVRLAWLSDPWLCSPPGAPPASLLPQEP